jgi:hypothetical protein
METYQNEQDFFSNLYDYKDNPRRINWARIIRTFHECGGDVNYHDRFKIELILELNNTSDVLTPDVFRELMQCGFTFENKDVSYVSYYGRIGAYGSYHNHPLKIEVMEMLCRDFNWLNVVDDDTIKRFVFGLNGYTSDYSSFYLEFHFGPELAQMYLKYDDARKIRSIWTEIPNQVKATMNQDFVKIMDE